MALEVDALIDRRRLKRSVILWRVVAVVLALAVVGVAAARFGAPLLGGHVARLDIGGVITHDRERIETIEAVAGNDGARALLVRIDSPGGTVVGGEALYRALRLVAERKPVVVVMETVATSAGYMAALGGDHLVAREGSLTGSIGVIIQTTDITGLLESIGVEAEAIKSAPLKAVPNPLEELDERGREATHQVVMDIYGMFVDLVAERRGLARPAALDLADGRIYTGRQALDAGLIDQLGGEREARAWLAEQHGIGAAMRTVDVTPRASISLGPEALVEAGGKMLFSEILTLDGLVSLWQPDAQ